MSIPRVELTDTFDTQRRRLNAAIDVLNGGTAISPGNGLTNAGGVLSVKKTGDGLSFDASGNLVGNDAYANLITQVILNVDDPAPIPTTITSTTIVFPAFSVLFADNAFYGKKISDYTTITVPETNMTLQEGVNGAVYVYVNTAGQILQSLTPISPADSATKCLLGSYFRMSNTIQSGSWAYTPWNGATSKDLRFYEGASLRGGLIQPMATYSLSRTALTVLKEGVNISTSIYDPNNITYAAENPYTTKELWPGYDPTALDSPTLDTTHVYNITNNQVEDISSLDGYVVLVPGVVSVTGQDVYLMAMSPKVDGEYTQIFDNIDDATRGVYSLQVSLGNVASRVSWLGQSIIVKIGCTDYTDSRQLRIVGQIPNSLGSSSNYPGAAGGAVVQGLTIKDDGTALLPTDNISTIDFKKGVIAKGVSETEAQVGLNITNCVTSTRDTINVELDNGSFVLKAGSKVYVPNGFEQDATTPKFDEVTISTDVSVSTSIAAHAIHYIFYKNGQLYFSEWVYSGSTQPSGHGIMFWYDTTNNIIKRTTESGSIWTNDYSLPIAIVETDSNGLYNNIIKLFNVYGYIDTTGFILPGFKVLIPNGWNSDRTLNSREVTTTSISLFDIDSYGILGLNESGIAKSNEVSYDYEENYNKLENGTHWDYAMIGSISYNREVFFKSPFRPIDYYDIEELESNAYHPDILDWKWADHILNDAQWLRGDTFSWQPGNMYKVPYKHLVDDFNDAYVGLPSNGDRWNRYPQSSELGTNYWNSIVYDGSKLVALSSTGYISTSTDGTTWTTATQDANLGNYSSWQTIVYGNGKFLALSSGGFIATSTDGTTWTTAVQVLGISFNWRRLSYNSSNFVALDYDGTIATSTDGTTWTAIPTNDSPGSGGLWNGLAYDGLKFVAIGSMGAVAVSLPDPLTETISGITVSYYPGSDGHKICLADQEANVADMYTATGSAWYYILDTDSQQFKLPRKHSTQIVKEYDNGTNWYRLYADGWVEQGGTATTVSSTPKQITLPIEMSTTGYIPHIQGQTISAGYSNATWQVMPVNTTASPKTTTSFYGQSSIDGYNLTFTWSVSGQSAIDMSSYQADQKYRYFYVGVFNSSALRNTAGVTTEVLNNKVDKSQLQIVSQLPAQLVEGVIYFVYGS